MSQAPLPAHLPGPEELRASRPLLIHYSMNGTGHLDHKVKNFLTNRSLDGEDSRSITRPSRTGLPQTLRSSKPKQSESCRNLRNVDDLGLLHWSGGAIFWRPTAFIGFRSRGEEVAYGNDGVCANQLVARGVATSAVARRAPQSAFDVASEHAGGSALLCFLRRRVA